MGPADLQRYKKLLLEKQQELSPAKPTESRLPAAGSGEGDLVDQANADAEAELQIRLHETDGRLLRAIEDALARMRHGTYGVCTIAGSRSRSRVSRQCPGPTSVEGARSASAASFRRVHESVCGYHSRSGQGA